MEVMRKSSSTLAIVSLSILLVLFVSEYSFASTNIKHYKAEIILAPVAPIGPNAGGSPGASEFYPVCLLVNDTSPKIQAVYVYDQTRIPSLRDVNNIRMAMEESDRIVYLSADKQGGGRRLKISTENYGFGCRVKVDYLPMPRSFFLDGGSDESKLNQALISSKILDNSNLIDPNSNAPVVSNGVIPVAFINNNYNDNSNCGLGDSIQDDAVDGANSLPASNLAMVWKSCWNAYTVTHEIMHTLGAVQPSAPHSTPSGHCYNGIDIMCYDDSSSVSSVQKIVCPSTSYRPGGLLDCNGDDYFAVNPSPGSYLSTHYNIANNSPYILKTNYSGTPWPTIFISVDTKASTLPFVGVPFIATGTALGGLLFLGSTTSYGNDNCGVQLTSKPPTLGKTSTFSVYGVAYCRTNYETIRNVNNVLVGSDIKILGSHIAIADSMGRDSQANINFTLKDNSGMSNQYLPTKDTHSISMPSKTNNSYIVKLNIKGKLPGSNFASTPLVGLSYMILDQTTYKEIPQNGRYSKDILSDAYGNMSFTIPANLAGHIIDLENDGFDGNVTWRLPITQFKLPLIKKKN